MESLSCQGEFLRDKDGKLRYSNEVRTKMFKFIIDEFKKYSLDYKIFFMYGNSRKLVECISCTS